MKRSIIRGDCEEREASELDVGVGTAVEAEARFVFSFFLFSGWCNTDIPGLYNMNLRNRCWLFTVVCWRQARACI